VPASGFAAHSEHRDHTRATKRAPVGAHPFG
jgi:hypothetical protein